MGARNSPRLCGQPADCRVPQLSSGTAKTAEMKKIDGDMLGWRDTPRLGRLKSAHCMI